MSKAPEGLTAKGKQTRQRLYDTALRLFAQHGFAGTTMRDIAIEAGCSLGLAYRYFATKDDIVIALYRQLADDLRERVDQLPQGSIAKRFRDIMEIKLASIAPHRQTIAAIAGHAMDPGSRISVSGGETAIVRRGLVEVFHVVVLQATDAPRPQQARQVASVLYAIHLLLLLFWLNDRSEGCSASERMLRAISEGISRLRGFLWLPPVTKILGRVAEAITNALDLDGDPPTTSV